MPFDRIMYPVMHVSREVKVIAGSFAPNSSSAVSAASNKGRGFSVVRTSTGLFTITFEDKFVELLDAECSLQLASGDDKFVQLGTIDLTAKTAQIRVWDNSAAAVADVSANANNRINFCFAFRSTSRN